MTGPPRLRAEPEDPSDATHAARRTRFLAYRQTRRIDLYRPPQARPRGGPYDLCGNARQLWGGPMNRGLAAIGIAMLAYTAFVAVYGPLWRDAYGGLVHAAFVLATR